MSSHTHTLQQHISKLMLFRQSANVALSAAYLVSTLLTLAELSQPRCITTTTTTTSILRLER